VEKATYASQPQDFAGMMIEASAELRERFHLTVGGIEITAFGPSIVLVGENCNVLMFADCQRERDFELALIRSGLNTPEAVEATHEPLTRWAEKSFRELVRERGTPEDIRKYLKLSTFSDWRTMFRGTLPASTYSNQFKRFCDLFAMFAKDFLVGSASLGEPTPLDPAGQEVRRK
jgi:hypothetical protein